MKSVYFSVFIKISKLFGCVLGMFFFVGAHIVGAQIVGAQNFVPVPLAHAVQSEKIFSQKFDLPKRPYYHSEIIQTNNNFNALAVKNLHADVQLHLRINDSAYDIDVDEDEGGTISELIFLDELTDKIEIIAENPQVIAHEIQIDFFNTKIDEQLEESDLMASQIALSGLKVVSRKGWGVDESLRYRAESSEDGDSSSDGSSTSVSSKVQACLNLQNNYPQEFKLTAIKEIDSNGQKYKWPLEYAKKISKIVVHHTAENNLSERSPKEVLRAIYYYHTITRGWGDIGYNYLVDRNGVIYEGRAGGDFVVAGHTYCYNIGTAGVSLMGNFQEINPTTAQINSLINLLDVLARKYDINPVGESKIHGKDGSNILGHRDLAATACPGVNAYQQLDYVRQKVLLASDYDYEDSSVNKKDYSAKLMSSVKILEMKPTKSRKVTFKFKNTGKKTWDKNNWLFVFGNPQAGVAVKNVVEGKNYVAADMKEKIVKPGETATFEVEILSGYQEGFFTFEFTPVANGQYKINDAVVVQPFSVSKPTISYKLVKREKLPKNLFPGEEFSIWVDLKNTGNTSWFNSESDMYWNEMSLGTIQPRDRISPFKEENPSRLGFLEKQEIKPGQTGRFLLELIAPVDPGIYREYYAPVINDVQWLDTKSLSFVTRVIEPVFRFLLMKKDQRTVFMVRGKDRETTLTIRNISNFVWDKDKFSFVIEKRSNDLKVLDPKTGQEIEEIVLTKDVGKQKNVDLKILLQASPGARPVQGIMLKPKYGRRVISSLKIPLWVIVEKTRLEAELSSKLEQFYTLNSGKEEKLTFEIKNTGNVAWKNSGENQVYLRSHAKRESKVRSKKWKTEEQAGPLQEKTVNPGEKGTFELWVKPGNRGFVNEKFSLYMKGSGDVTLDPIQLRARVIGTASNPTKSKVIKPQAKAEVLPIEKVEVENNSSNIAKQNVSSIKDLIRVKLSFENEKIEISGTGNFEVTDLDGEKLVSNTKSEMVELNKNLLEINGNKKEGIRFISDENTILEIKNWNHSPGWNPDLNDNKYRGNLELRAIDGKLVVINELPLNDYLKGIAEVSNSAHPEKIKVLAILARTYAAFYLDSNNRKFPGLPYDASDDPNIFQKYLGYGYEQRSPKFSEAVSATAGLVVTYQGELVKTPYFSQSDGKTLSAKEVWGWTHTPYLQSVSDPHCAGMERQGHGVGLSGYGATKAAESGKGYEEIIKYYYQGVEVERL